MMPWLSLFPIVLSFLLIGCSMETTATSNTSVSNSQTIALAGQMLPISGEAILPDGTRIQLEVARTPQQQAQGLMYRPALPDNRGMLFQFGTPRPVNFWMKNVPVPLDMVFLQNGVIQYIEGSAPPCRIEPCPTYGPNVPIDMVIELRSGRAAELDLQPGDQVKIEFFDGENLPS